MQYLKTSNAPGAIGPYSQAVIHNNILYTSGQIAIDPSSGLLMNESITIETERVMKNMEAVLIAANTSFDKVIKSTIYLKDMNDFDVVNSIYAKFMVENHLPARETIQVSRLPKDVSIEISMIVAI